MDPLEGETDIFKERGRFTESAPPSCHLRPQGKPLYNCSRSILTKDFLIVGSVFNQSILKEGYVLMYDPNSDCNVGLVPWGMFVFLVVPQTHFLPVL